MTVFLIRRLLWTGLTLWLVASLTFAMTVLLPSDPARMIAGPHADAQTIQEIRSELGLDDPLPIQYGRYMGKIMQGDLGKSYRTQYPVMQDIKERFPRTMLLALAAIFFELLIGIPIGIIAALKPGRPADYLSMSGALLGISAPTFFIGLLLMYVMGFQWELFPIGGYGSGGLDTLWHLVLPALTLGLAGAAYHSRLIRSEMLEILGLDYVRTARAKGLTEWFVIGKHVLRNALVPVVTLVGLDLGVLLGGAVITEAVFAWPGLGKLAIDGIYQRDLPVIMGTVIVSSTMILMANILVDLSYSWLDPRSRKA